mgnify:FL=1|jgi:hypothetical protein
MKGVLIVLGCVVGIPLLIILGYFVYISLAVLAPAISGACLVIYIAIWGWLWIKRDQ